MILYLGVMESLKVKQSQKVVSEQMLIKASKHFCTHLGVDSTTMKVLLIAILGRVIAHLSGTPVVSESVDQYDYNYEADLVIERVKAREQVSHVEEKKDQTADSGSLTPSLVLKELILCS